MNGVEMIYIQMHRKKDTKRDRATYNLNKRSKCLAYASPRVSYFFLKKHVVLQLLKRYWKKKKKTTSESFQ
jgi:hypothetical protein